jgi:hypothetical protein
VKSELPLVHPAVDETRIPPPIEKVLRRLFGDPTAQHFREGPTGLGGEVETNTLLFEK